jgi:hypothetical protein
MQVVEDPDSIARIRIIFPHPDVPIGGVQINYGCPFLHAVYNCFDNT